MQLTNATTGSSTKVAVVRTVKTATTRKSESIVNIRKSFFALWPIQWSMTSPIDFPSWRIEAMTAPKSCGPPRNMEPKMHHTIVGSQPNIEAAVIGPTMGPAPAMDEKWCPSTTAGCVGQ